MSDDLEKGKSCGGKSACQVVDDGFGGGLVGGSGGDSGVGGDGGACFSKCGGGGVGGGGVGGGARFCQTWIYVE